LHYFLFLRPKQPLVLSMPPGGIRTRNPSNREAIDPLLRPHGAEIGVTLMSRSWINVRRRELGVVLPVYELEHFVVLVFM
jgi:hypothetical protein